MPQFFLFLGEAPSLILCTSPSGKASAGSGGLLGMWSYGAFLLLASVNVMWLTRLPASLCPDVSPWQGHNCCHIFIMMVTARMRPRPMPHYFLNPQAALGRSPLALLAVP